jgi:hypothetical protein
MTEETVRHIAISMLLININIYVYLIANRLGKILEKLKLDKEK